MAPRERCGKGILGFDTATSDAAVAVAIDGEARERAPRRAPSPAAAPATVRSCWPRSKPPSPRPAAGSGSRASRSGSARARSPGCEWGSRPPGRSARPAGSRSRGSGRSRHWHGGSPSETDDRSALALIDARRGELFAALFDRSGDALREPFVIGPEALADRLSRATGPSRWRRGTARYAFVSNSSPRAWRCSPTRTRPTGSRPGTSARWPPVPSRGCRRTSNRLT